MGDNANPTYLDTGMFDNSGIWIFALLILLFGAGGFGFGGNGGLTENTLERAIDLNSVQNGQRDIESRVQEIGAENIAATKDMGYNLLGNIRDVEAAVALANANQQNCCCEIKSAIAENRYIAEKNASAIMMNDTTNTQKVLDKITEYQIANKDAKINELQRQIDNIGTIKYPMAMAYNAGTSPFCNNGCGGCGCY